jgi:hypothetical protein
MRNEIYAYMAATPPARRGPRSVVAVPRRNLAAVASVHACASADSQEQVAADDAAVGGQ